jgi:hypothetical protein
MVWLRWTARSPISAGWNARSGPWQNLHRSRTDVATVVADIPLGPDERSSPFPPIHDFHYTKQMFVLPASTKSA